jgi:DNA polymerase-3 subunit gamma/tau
MQNQNSFKEPLSKKYRPQNFSDIIYHDDVKTILINSILEKNIANGILLYGEKGTGKTTIARIFAKSLNCENPKNSYEPCNICDSCQEISQSRHPDVAEIDAASKNSIDSIRELIEEAKYLPIKSEYKIYILDEVHMLSNSAFNALLKILEEPPHYVKFCLSTTEYHKIPPTITSRCQRLNLRKINNNILKKQLETISQKENIKIDEKSLHIISSIAKGSARDAISILDQAAILANQNITSDKLSSIVGYQDDESELIDLINEICNSNTEKCLQMIDDLYQKNISIDLLFNKILDLLTELMVYQKIGTLNEKQNLYISNIEITKINQITKQNNFEKLNQIWNVFIESQNILKDNIYDNQLYLLNLTILRAAVNENENLNQINDQFKVDHRAPKLNDQRNDVQNALYDKEPIIVSKKSDNNIQRSQQMEEKIQTIEQNSKAEEKNQAPIKESKPNSPEEKERKLLQNHNHLLLILKKLKEEELLRIAQNHEKIFNYQTFEIYDDHTIPTRFLQMFFKILRQYSKEKWRIVYVDSNDKSKIEPAKINNKIENIEQETQNKNSIQITPQKNSFSEIKNEFLKTDFFKKAQEKFDIQNENVKITK